MLILKEIAVGFAVLCAIGTFGYLIVFRKNLVARVLQVIIALAFLLVICGAMGESILRK